MNQFLDRIAEVLELDEATEETVLRDCEVWDSLTALSLVAMIDKHDNVTISADDLARSVTAGDLMRIVDAKKK
ncbi:MAG TPA: acyl carrier protein [Thermoanaerobaculia bacterium]|nr:acyl carrier protein [Thermoanaerobaculia bacterium]